MSTRVLYVDDEPDMREIAILSLGLDPELEVRACSSGQEALDAAGPWRPDIALLDVMMPGMDGPTTLEHLRREARTRHTPVLFCTAKAQPAELRQLGNADVAGVLSKPFDPLALGAQIARQLGWDDD